jgi:hypothetical protein
MCCQPYSEEKRPGACSFVLEENLRLENYHPSCSFVIDPAVDYITRVRGCGAGAAL